MGKIITTASTFLLTTLGFHTIVLSNAMNDERRGKQICSLSGGLDATRLVSSTTRDFFRDAIDDVELIREYVTESMHNGGILGGMHDLSSLAKTLDWKARNLTINTTTTLQAGLAWSDDRVDRRMERYIGLLANDPLFMGSKTADIVMADTVSNIFPWIVDRKSMEKSWWLDHSNGQTTEHDSENKEELSVDQLYVAAWLGTLGEAWMYYPPLRVSMGHPFVLSELGGDAYDSQKNDKVQPNLPRWNPERQAIFTKPYPDKTQPDSSLITAMAPIYYTGKWQGSTYDETYMASTGVDINVTAVSTLLDELDGTLTNGSFAFLVDQDFNMIVISQPTVERLYPERTGMEESRITYDMTDGSIVADRRNQTYLASDTILQSPLNLSNADWKGLHNDILSTLSPGGRGYFTLEIILTGDANSTSFYAMCERWPDVADWILVTLAPREEVDNAVNPRFTELGFDSNVILGNNVDGEAVLINDGLLDLVFTVDTINNKWLRLEENHTNETQILWSVSNKTLKFHGNTSALDLGTELSCDIRVHVEDYQYPDCFYERTITFKVHIKIVPEPELNLLGNKKYIMTGIICGLVFVTSLTFIIWVHLRRQTRIIRASQPIFLHMLCIGTIFLGVSAIPLLIDDSHVDTRGCDIACMAFPWLFSTGFCIVFSALFAKIWRINKIFHAAKTFRRIKVKEKDAIIPFAILFSLNVLLLLIWTVAAPLKWNRVYTSENSSYGTCYAGMSPIAVAMMALLIIVNLAAVVNANRQAFQARSIGDEFSESSYIAIAMASILQMFLVGIPMLFFTQRNPAARYYIMSSIVFVVAMSLLLLIFVPKILFVRANQKDIKSSRKSNVSVTQSWMKRPARSSAFSSSETESGLKVVTMQPQAESTDTDTEYYKMKAKEVDEMVKRLKSKLEAEGLDAQSLFEEFQIDDSDADESVTPDT